MVDVNLGNVRGLQGLPGATGNGIRSIEKTGTSGKVDTYTITYDNGSTKTFTVTNGSDGSTVSFTRTLSSGTKLGTITINGVSTDLYCNSGGSADIVTSWEQLLSDVKVPSEKLTKNTIDTKQDVLVSGTNISTINGQSLLNGGNLQVGNEVGSFNDLKSLIDNANANSTIILNKDYKYASSDDVTDEGIVIDKNLTIIGNGHIIDGEEQVIKPFNVDGATVSFMDMVIQNCHSSSANLDSYGGAIIIKGISTVNFVRVDFINNSSDLHGGAIYGGGNSVVNIIDSTFIRNSAYGQNCVGGAIYGGVNTILNIERCVFTENKVRGYGGAIYGVGNNILNMSTSTFKSNTATDDYGDIYCDNFTIVYDCEINNINTTCYNVKNVPYMTDNDIKGTFTDLKTLIDNANNGDIICLNKDYQYNASTDASINYGVDVNKNISIIGNGHIIDGNSSKRAFSVIGNYTLNLIDLRVENCNCSYGGAIRGGNGSKLNIINCIFSKNNNPSGSVEEYGGVINVWACNVDIINSVFTHNTAVCGGAIYVNEYCTLNLRDSVFRDNTAEQYGGAIWFEYIGTTTITNTSFTKNSARYGGGIYCDNTSGVMSIKDSVFKSNTASSYANIDSDFALTVYNCDINDISTTCHNITNYNSVTSDLIVDDLTTNDATKVLSAKQGKVLYDLIDGVEEDMLL